MHCHLTKHRRDTWLNALSPTKSSPSQLLAIFTRWTHYKCSRYASTTHRTLSNASSVHRQRYMLTWSNDPCKHCLTKTQPSTGKCTPDLLYKSVSPQQMCLSLWQTQMIASALTQLQHSLVISKTKHNCAIRYKDFVLSWQIFTTIVACHHDMTK